MESLIVGVIYELCYTNHHLRNWIVEDTKPGDKEMTDSNLASKDLFSKNYMVPFVKVGPEVPGKLILNYFD